MRGIGNPRKVQTLSGPMPYSDWGITEYEKGSMMPVKSFLIAFLILTATVGSPSEAAARKKSPKDAERPAAEAPDGKSRADLLRGTEEVAGLFTFHRSSDKLYLELPAALLGAPLGFSTVAVGALGDFYPRGAAVETQLVRWERVGGRLLLFKVNVDFRAEEGSSLRYAVRDSFPDSPVFSAPLEKISGEGETLIVDAGKLFTAEMSQILAPSAANARADGTIVASIKGFDDNVVARVRYRFERKPSAGGEGSNPFARYRSPGRLPDDRFFEAVVDYNFYRLPDDGYRPRRFDERIGGMTLDFKDYTDIDRKDTAFRHLLRRWDLRKADPTADVSEPVEPITFYVDPSVPEEWRPLVKEGATWWNTAFEKIGFKNAVRVLDPPDDGTFDVADMRYSVIFWNLSDDLVFSGLAGPVFADPRTGEALKGAVYLNGEFFSYARNRYLVYAWWRAPEPGGERFSTKRDVFEALRKTPGFCDRGVSFSSQMAFARLVLGARGVLEPGTAEADRFAREAFLELVAHEVGHALGFPHNWKASTASDWDDIVAGRVTGRRGGHPFSASVMDYNPIYLAPKGEPQGDYFLQELGAWDDLIIEYIYRPFDGLSAAEEEAELDRIASRAESEPGLDYDSGELGAIDPTTNSDDLGDDVIAFAASRLAMIQEEVLPKLPELVLGEGHDYSHLRGALDAAIFSVALDYIDMTARHVGGQILWRRVASPASPEGGPPPVVPVPAEDQRRALKVLDERLFAEGLFSLPPETLALLKSDLAYDWNYPWRYGSDYNLGHRVAGLYEAALSTLLEPARLTRVLDNERRVGDGEAFTLPELFRHLEATAFDGTGERIGADRRALQRELVDHLVGLVLKPQPGTPAEASQLAAWSLESIGDRIDDLLGSDASFDGYTEAHLADLAKRVRRTLEAEVDLEG